MTRDERLKYNNAMNVLDYKIIGRPHVVAEPNAEQLQAMQMAIDVMEKQMMETGKPMHKHISVLGYHLAHPTALLFKDRYTVDALTAGILAIKWLLGLEEKEKLVFE